MSDYQHIAFCDKRHLIIISLKNPPDLQIETRHYKVEGNRKKSMLTYKWVSSQRKHSDAVPGTHFARLYLRLSRARRIVPARIMR